MNFGILDKICTFVMFYAKELTSIGSRDFYILSSDVLSIKIKAIKLRWLTCFHTCKCSLARMEGDSLSSFNNFKIHSQMPKNNESEVQVQSALTSQPKSKSKLEQKLSSALSEVAELQNKLDLITAKFYQREFYLARNCHFTFSIFEKNNPVDKCDWKKLYETEMKLREAEG